MDKTLTPAKSLINPLLVLLVLLLISLLAFGIWSASRQFDPYVEEVLARQGNSAQGKAIFEANCGVCHGWEGRGNIGPSLENVAQRKSPPSLIQQVISGKTPPMPKFQPDSQTMADLLAYLETL